MEKEKNNKSMTPSSNKMVTIKINKDRAIAGIGKAGDVVEVSELVAMNFIGQGLASIVEKEK